jgi:hypothetical protein
MDGLTADFDPSVGESDVKKRGRDRWRVTPPAIRVTDTRDEGGPFQLLVTTRGDDWTACQFDQIRAFAFEDASGMVRDVAVVGDQAEWLRPNQTILLASGETYGPTAAIIIRLVAEVHTPSGEPPIDFALELLPIQTPTEIEETIGE